MKPTGQQLIAEFLGCSTLILNDKRALQQAVHDGIRKSGLTAIRVESHQFHPTGVTVFAIISESHIAIHTYPEARHASIDIFTCSPSSKKQEALLQCLKRSLKPKAVRYVETIRGNPLSVRRSSWFSEFDTNGYEVRYHIQRYILSKQTPYQQLDIIQNEDFGLMLFLDRELQVAEQDAHLYNRSLTSPLFQGGKTPRHIAILGGGDGGVLQNLLEYKPRSVTLVDLDRDVIDSAQKFLQPVCKNAFTDPAVTLTTAEASAFLAATEKTFDAIICDLTMHPEKDMNEERERYWRTLLARVASRLKKSGLMTVQCGSERDAATISLFEKLLPRHFKNVLFQTTFIPSFCEPWVFAEAKVI